MPEELNSTQKEGVKKAGRPIRKARPNGDSAVSAKSQKNEEGGGFKSLLMLIAVAVIVGGAVYGWQKSTKDSLVDDLKKASDTAKSELEKQLTVLDNQLKGIEKENESLKQNNEELKTKADLLSGAVKRYSNDDLGIAFEYPAEYGEVKLDMKDGDTGSGFTGTFSLLDSISFGGSSKDFSAKEGKSALNSQGYEKKKKDDKDIFVLKYAWTPEKELEFKPVKMIKNDFALVNSASFPAQAPLTASSVPAAASETATSTPGNTDGVAAGLIPEGGIGAVINLKKPSYTGLVFLNQNLEKFPQENFEKMLNSISLK